MRKQVVGKKNSSPNPNIGDNMVYHPVPDGHKLVFRKYRKDPKTGEMLDAAKYGFKAWPILVPDTVE